MPKQKYGHRQEKGIDVAINAFTVYVRSEEPLTERQLQRKAAELRDLAYSVVLEEERKEINADPEFEYSQAHIHISTPDMMCDHCIVMARNEIN